MYVRTCDCMVWYSASVMSDGAPLIHSDLYVQIKKAAPEAAAEKKPKMYEKKVKGGKRRQAKGGVKKKVKSK